MIALLLPHAYRTGWRPLVARSGPRPQRSRAAAAYFSAGIAERTRTTRTITVELATDDTSEDGPTDRVARTGAPVTVEVIVDHPSEGSAAADETAALEQPGRPLLTREQEYALAREIQVLTQWRRVRASLAAQAGGEAPSDEAWAAALGCTSDELRSQLQRSYAARCLTLPLPLPLPLPPTLSPPLSLPRTLTRYAARCQLIESNLRLVMSVASMAARRAPQVQLQDVVQDGVVDLEPG